MTFNRGHVQGTGAVDNVFPTAFIRPQNDVNVSVDSLKLAHEVCELLTFLTGRRVATPDRLGFHNFNISSDNACPPGQTLSYASTAFSHLSALIDRGLWNALAFYNTSIEHRAMQIKGYCLSVALDLFASKAETKPTGSLSSTEKSQLIHKMRSELTDFGITGKLREAYDRAITSAIEHPPWKSLDNITALLAEHDLLNASDVNEVRRLKNFNALRNSYTHSGGRPKVKNVHPDKVGEWCAAAVGGILPAIVRVLLSRSLNIAEENKSFQVDVEELRHYFQFGTWRELMFEDSGPINIWERIFS